MHSECKTGIDSLNLPDPKHADNRALVQFVLTYIDQHFRDDLRLPDIARAVGLAPAYLTDALRRATGRPVKKWVTERRLVEAKRLLVDTDLPVSHIATLSGFGEAINLIRNLRRQTGATPVAWRKRPIMRRQPDGVVDIISANDIAHRYVANLQPHELREQRELDVLGTLRALVPDGTAVIDRRNTTTGEWTRFDGTPAATSPTFNDRDANVRILLAGRPVLEADLAHSDFDYYRRLTDKRGLAAFYKVPFFVGDTCAGAIAVSRSVAGDFTMGQRAALEMIAASYGNAHEISSST